MAWFKVDDGFWSHPKVISLPPAAIALWVRAGSYSSQHLTDGKVNLPLLAILGAAKEDAEALVSAGLWDGKPDGKNESYSFHDWEFYQPAATATKAKRDELSQKRADAGRKGAANRWANGSQTDGNEHGNPDGKLLSRSDGKPMAPTRPDPTPTPSKEGVPRKRGSRVPNDFTITAEMREWAKRETPLVNVDQKLGEWVDYWTGVAGAKGVKADWVSTWRNGMRKQQEFAVRDRGNTQTRRDPDAWMNA